MSMVSYAQNFEDVMLWRALKHVENGFYIDVGANDPVVDSVSLCFYERGWRGVHVEPTQQYADKLIVARPGEVVEQVAVGLREGSVIFYEFEGTGLSTADAEIAKRHSENGFSVKETIVDVVPLSVLFDKYSDREIHWLKIDVEGLENEVIASWRERETRPWIVVVESTEPLSKCESFREWEPILLEKGYEFVYFDGVNRFYVHEAHRELFDEFSTPPNFHDNFVLDSSHYLCGASLRDLKKREASIVDLKSSLSQAKSRERELEARVDKMGEESRSLSQRLEQMSLELNSISMELDSVYRSRSWRITAPVRLCFSKTRCILLGLEAWLRFKPGSKPRRYARKIAKAAYLFIAVRPKLRHALLSVIRRYPRFYDFLRSQLLNQSPPQISREDIDFGPGVDFNHISGELPLSPSGQRYYQKLVCSIQERD